MWFDRANYHNDLNLNKNFPNDWIGSEDIESVFLSYWCEHCLECAVPQCYQVCPLWKERIDKKCKKTFYGTHYSLVNSVVASTFLFSKWGKIETKFFGRCTTYNKFLKKSIKNASFEKRLRRFSDFISFLSPKYRFCGAHVVCLEKRLRKKGKPNLNPDAFLFQCYSNADRSYNMFIEFKNEDGVFFRENIIINKGFNQSLIDVSAIDMSKCKLVRFFPENDLTLEITVFFCDFVIFNKKFKENRLLPANKIKCIAWDLDNTLWDGILIESESKSLMLREGVLDTIKKLDERGIIQIICSKNNKDDVENELRRLNIFDYFVYCFANWNSKSDNLLAAARHLNININSFGLIDDSPFERNEVKTRIPNMRVYDEKIESLLLHEELDVPVTLDGKNRRKMYLEEIKRKEIENNFGGSNVDFLKSCMLQITIDSINESNKLRCLELIQRTNQLNLSGIKYSLDDFTRLCDENKKNTFALSCFDKYGSYGQVGFVSIRIEQNAIVVFEYAVSCRVAGKFIEPAIVFWLTKKYGKNKVVFSGVDNKKNKLLIDTLKGFGFIDKSSNKDFLLLEQSLDCMKDFDVVSVNDNTI